MEHAGAAATLGALPEHLCYLVHISFCTDPNSEDPNSELDKNIAFQLLLTSMLSSFIGLFAALVMRYNLSV
jgi:hypothetical protein